MFLDFSKAFDTVDHDILLRKLEKYGIRGTALDWFTDYLSNRLQYVTYNGAKSIREIIKCGVPQRSILDETNMFVTGKNTSEMCVKLNNDLQRNRDIHGLNTRQANDFYVPFSRLQIRRFSIKIHGSEVWNSSPTYIKISTSLMNF